MITGSLPLSAMPPATGDTEEEEDRIGDEELLLMRPVVLSVRETVEDRREDVPDISSLPFHAFDGFLCYNIVLVIIKIKGDIILPKCHACQKIHCKMECPEW